jgi:legumain
MVGFFKSLATVATVAAAEEATGKHWAVLVAGSSGYGNYRHQADVCHAYQVVKSHGIPEENIIVMAYDDIANNSRNPFPGKLFNKPTAAGEAGVDVYEGCKIDYSGTDVTPANFQKILTGTMESGKKQLESNSDDNVFVFFSDHGGAGLICFPSENLHKADLQSTFDTMHSKNMYKKLVFYLETCESGSMFEGMSTPGVYAISASNPTESSWGTYCGSDAMVDGKSIGSCLGDLFSVSWMEDSDVTDLTQETLDAQFSTVHTKTSKSEVMQWGDLSFTSDMVSEYQSAAQGRSATGTASKEPARSAVSARQIDLKQAYDRYVQATTSQDRLAAGAELQAVLNDQIEAEAAYERFLDLVYPGDDAKKSAVREGSAPANNRDCELSARENFMSYGNFDSFSGFSLQFHKYVVNTCADVVATGANIDVAHAAKQACIGATIV